MEGYQSEFELADDTEMAFGHYSDRAKKLLKANTGIPNTPTDLTYECRWAVSGVGPRAFDWKDKPHRLIFDLCREIERLNSAA